MGDVLRFVVSEEVELPQIWEISDMGPMARMVSYVGVLNGGILSQAHVPICVEPEEVELPED